jgi:hypothetical protein
VLASIVKHHQLWWRIEDILIFNLRESILLFFNEAHNFRIENQFPHADLQYSTISKLESIKMAESNT